MSNVTGRVDQTKERGCDYAGFNRARRDNRSRFHRKNRLPELRERGRLSLEYGAIRRIGILPQFGCLRSGASELLPALWIEASTNV